MHLSFSALAISLTWLLVSTAAQAQETTFNLLRQQVRDQSATAEKNLQPVIPGRDDWLFFTAELRAISCGPFWGTDAARVSRSTNPQFADPLPAIVDFQEQLKRAGIELLLVPVPAKIAIYPEQLLDTGDSKAAARLDGNHAEFYRLLLKQGIRVLDVHPEFTRQKNKAPLYCRTDSHWSGQGVELATELISAEIKTAKWYSELTREQKLDPTAFRVQSKTLEVTGDLARLQNESQPATERVTLSEVKLVTDGKLASIPTDVSSPILVLGDSHTLVFHDPQLFGPDCGLVDHLARTLNIKLDLIGVRGSGANAARITWRRRPNPLVGKKLVIWCLSVREFTENSDGWKKIPVQAPKKP